MRSAQRAGTAWQGLVSGAGSKEMKNEMGRTPAAPPPQPSTPQFSPRQQGINSALESPGNL